MVPAPVTTYAWQGAHPGQSGAVLDKDSRKPKLPGTAWLLLCGVVVGGLSLTSGLYSWTQAQVMQEYHEAIQLRIAPQNARIQSYLDARILFLEDLARCMELQEPPSDRKSVV